ncbi:MAG: GNAT family N-acetyltransferase [Alphaproteobacteria bacterium]|nr:GNAT family N-acetyltransferase [Alphaproteobacteria bacterium]MBV9371979.1 GNAT family N-acetyltransferase [Alphaproteobacteria bacterium]MBV9902636.1 GNAT family N-acetyltransferase [Alphaproteobacteria bacterium]
MTGSRDATLADLPVIDALFRTSFVETFGHLYREEDLAAFLARFTPEAWRQEFTDPAYRFRLGLAGDEPAGFAKISPVTLPVTPEAPALELRQLYLTKRFHGLGVAGLLMDWVLAQARQRGAKELYLTVWTGNGRAKAFYRRYGFTYVAPYAFMVGEQADEDEIWRLRLG